MILFLLLLLGKNQKYVTLGHNNHEKNVQFYSVPVSSIPCVFYKVYCNDLFAYDVDFNPP